MIFQRNYKAEYESTKAQNTPLAESNEMILTKDLAKLKDKEYQSEAKASMGNVNIDAGMLFEIVFILSVA